MMRNNPMPPIVGIVLGIVVSIGACQSDDAADPNGEDPTPSPSKSLPTSSDELPEVPETATKRSKEGALSFGKYYYDAINYGRATGDWKLAKDMTASSCAACEDFWDENSKRMNNDLSIRFESGPIVSRFIDKEAYVSSLVSSDRDIENPLREDRESWSHNIRLEYRNDNWKVVKIDIEEYEQ